MSSPLLRGHPATIPPVNVGPHPVMGWAPQKSAAYVAPCPSCGLEAQWSARASGTQQASQVEYAITCPTRACAVAEFAARDTNLSAGVRSPS